MAGSPTQVFLSHTRSDKAFVERLAKDLGGMGLKVWLNEFQVGDSLVGAIESGIESSTWMVVAVSPAALQSQWVLKELRAGLVRETAKGTVFVLPAICAPVELPPFLRDKFYANFVESYEHGLALLRDRLIGKYVAESANDAWLLVQNPAAHAGDLDLYAFMSSSGYRFASPKTLETLRIALDGLRQPSEHKDSGRPETELWFGETGRLVLTRSGVDVHGDYDWRGLGLVARLEGKESGAVIKFWWSWSLSSETGKGVLWTDIPNILYGGWWSDFANVDEDRILRRQQTPPHAWEFARLRNLKVEETRG